MDKFVTLNKQDLNDFIVKLSRSQPVMAPVARGCKSFVFESVDSAKAIALHYIPTILPPKKYFFPQRETLLTYNKTTPAWDPVLESRKMVIFGVHTCDLAGIQCLNMVMSASPQDNNYNARKEGITIIGLECNNYCDEYASCNVMDNHLPNGGYDLFFTELPDAFMVHVNSNAGERIVNDIGFFSAATPKHTQQLEEMRARKREIFKPEVKAGHKQLRGIFAGAFDSRQWDRIGERCVACGNCTNVCPTCYCFDVRDEINLDFNTGTRGRVWDSCQNEEFAQVAGGENFRKQRGQRQRHRYMRKFNYPVERFSRYFCTGCGRCSRACMAKINLKETIDALAEEKR